MKCSVLFVFVFGWISLWSQRSDFNCTDFNKADSIAEHTTAHSLINLKALADSLTGSLPTEQEKFRAIYKWVCSNIEADYELLSLNKYKRTKLKGERLAKWNIKFNKMVFRTLVQENKTICTGYAYLVRELCYHAGLSCLIVNGYARHAGIDSTTIGSINHSWNKVLLNNKWYLCDATWSSGVFNLRLEQFVKKYNDQFFLTAPSVFYQTHYNPKKDTKD